jgi:transposase
MELQLTELLNLPGVVVEWSRNFGQELILDVEIDAPFAPCPNCQEVSHHLHQNHSYLVRDLPLGKKQVYLRVNRRQFKCKNCEKPFSEELNFVGRRKKYTHRYAKHITEQVVNSDLHNVARRNCLTEPEVESMINHVSQQVLPVNLKSLKRLGIDEISLVKGQGKYVVVLVDLDTGKLVGLVKERKLKSIEKLLKSWGDETLGQIEEVSMDLYKLYKTVVEKLCPNAVVTVDRFHVTKLLNEELNQGRIDQKKTAESLEIEPRKKLFNSLKGCKYVLLKRESNLKKEQKKKLLEVKEASPVIGVMHELKEEFTKIFEESKNLGEGTFKLIEWLKKAQPFFRKTVQTIKNWFAEIVGYFEQGTTNGMVEGINNRLKVLKRCGFGFRNFDNFEKRALLLWHLADSLA